ncbi:MAG: biotin transporter BioY, partial [Clostridia bacterium]|nr:biotin transporter BioY [Clostridia bacterium]
ASVGLYLLLGAAGLPIFSGYTAGISRFAGTGGGYLLGYLFLAGISAFFVRQRPEPQKYPLGGWMLAFFPLLLKRRGG